MCSDGEASREEGRLTNMLWVPEMCHSQNSDTVRFPVLVDFHERLQIEIGWDLEKTGHQLPGVSPHRVTCLVLSSSTS